ncbi:MAG TPA: SDR family NAD(P)-dependent oxidoreductase [Chloroflexia bacterium]
MSLLTIVGAGPGMGLAIARLYGQHGFEVALVARDQDKLGTLVDQLGAEGIKAKAFQADVADHASLKNAFNTIKTELGEIDVLEFSPSNRELPMASATEVTIESIQAWMDFYVYGAVTVVQQVLPDMLARNSGTLLFTTGASSVYPNPMLGNIGIATAGLRNWIHSLHTAVADKGVQVGHVAINAWIGLQPGAEPENIAQLYWELYSNRDQVELVFDPPIGN